MKKDKLDPQEWLLYAEADLDSAEILLNNTKNYHIAAYHAHQATEKIIKRYLMIKNIQFPFIHDLSALIKCASQLKDFSDYLRDASFLMDIYVATRYPGGDTVTKEDAIKSVAIAKRIFQAFLN